MHPTEIIRFFFALLISSMTVTVVCQFYLLFQKKSYTTTVGSRQLKQMKGEIHDQHSASLAEPALPVKDGNPVPRHPGRQSDGVIESETEGRRTTSLPAAENLKVRLVNQFSDDRTGLVEKIGLSSRPTSLPAKNSQAPVIIRGQEGEEIARQFYAKFAMKLEKAEKDMAVYSIKTKSQRISAYAEAFKKYNISSKKGTVLSKNKKGETKVLVTLPQAVPTIALELERVPHNETKQEFSGYKHPDQHKKYWRQKMKKVEQVKTPGMLNYTKWQSYIDRHDYRYILNPTEKCMTSEGTFKKISLLMIVASSPTNFERRDAIRRTWGMAARNDAMHLETVFLLGVTTDSEVQQELHRELVNCGDLVQEDFQDSYLNLTIKTVMGLKWASRHCQNAKFVMKTDDDMMVNTIKMLVYLRTAPWKNFVAGKAAFNYDIIRDVYNKFYVPYSVTKDDKYPPYCIGIGYVLSIDVVHKVYLAALQTPLFPWEDVFVGMCLRRVGVIPTMIKGFMGGGFFDENKGVIKTDHTSLSRLRASYVIHDITLKQMEWVWAQWSGLA